MSDRSPMLNRPGAIAVGTDTGDKPAIVGSTDGILSVDIGLAAVAGVECGPSAVLSSTSVHCLECTLSMLPTPKTWSSSQYSRAQHDTKRTSSPKAL